MIPELTTVSQVWDTHTNSILNHKIQEDYSNSIISERQYETAVPIEFIKGPPQSPKTELKYSITFIASIDF